MPQRARHRGGHRRRRHRLRVRLDDGRPRQPGHGARGAAQDPPRLRQGRRPRSSSARSRSAASTSAPASRSPATSPGDGGTVRQRRGRRPARGRRRGRLGRPPPAAADLGLDGTRSRSTSAASSRSTSCCRTGEDGVWAIGDVHRHARSSPTSGSPRPSSAIKDILGEDAAARSTTARCPWCIYCHPEVAFAGHTEQAAKEAGLDVVASKHRYSGNSRALIVGEHRRPGEGHRREAGRRHRPARSSACTWSARGSPSSSARATWPSTGRPRSTRSPPSSSRTRRCRELFGETVLSLTGRRPARHDRRPTREAQACMADIKMPQLGETVTEGTITKWFKQVGDAGRRGRAAVRGVDRQGRLRGAVARRPAT